MGSPRGSHRKTVIIASLDVRACFFEGSIKNMTAKVNSVSLLSGLHFLQFDGNTFGQLSQQSLVFPQSLDTKKSQMKPHQYIFWKVWDSSYPPIELNWNYPLTSGELFEMFRELPIKSWLNLSPIRNNSTASGKALVKDNFNVNPAAVNSGKSVKLLLASLVDVRSSIR